MTEHAPILPSNELMHECKTCKNEHYMHCDLCGQLLDLLKGEDILIGSYQTPNPDLWGVYCEVCFMEKIPPLEDLTL